ncbi:MAG TPA: prolyl oligopeptidase family serine peptidase [Oligoflexus sp.]|uniref:prolyl oligopeptidase family serine peptidase n=1 Tax=Oligoflexus sp. TaxID=1971216 RepID=UPI002D6F2D48|nr:prolyl oligopeptidase family serine peptidase [Oligoflexus sp.]HYX35248.1 prolyl oligopeptidase family serine peptidase [Oligoflexus sp.]
MLARYPRLPLSAAMVLALGCTSVPNTSETGGSSRSKVSPPPVTKVQPVIDRHHEVDVTDPYRWLESGQDKNVQEFIKQQNEYARTYLDALESRESLRQQLNEILGASSISYRSLHEVQGQLFALKQHPPKQHRFLVTLPDAGHPEKERVVIDPDALEPKGKVAIDWYRVSPNGRYVAASLSVDGSEAGDVSVFEVATGKRVFEVIPGVNAGTAGGDLGWAPDSGGFYYTRYPRGDERPAADKMFFTQLYFHKLGTPTTADRFELGKDFSRIAEFFVEIHPSGRVIAAVQKGDGGEFQHYLRSLDGTWKQLADYPDRIAQFFFGERDDLYFISQKDAPHGKVMAVSLKDPSPAKARVIIPEGKDSIVTDITSGEGFLVHKGRLYVSYQTGGPSEIRSFDLDGKSKPGPRTAPVTGVNNVAGLANGDVLFAQRSYLEPTAYYHYSIQKNSTTKTQLQEKSPVDLTGVTVIREMVKSKDGTMIPVNIILPPGVKPGTPVPFVLNGYGGFSISIEPQFLGSRSVLLKSGVGYAIANLRGGSEFGETWHAQGSLTKKQNVFDDFIAAGEFLVQAKYALPGKVAIIGGSNGGLLVGAAITQRPELFAAAVASVGYFDMIRIESEPNGQFNTTEYGTIADKQQFEALYAYSPYHRIKDGTAYPPILMQVGATDQRVAPWHSRKMVARLQAASSSGAPALLYTRFDAGHGMGSSVAQQIDQNLDAYSFMLRFLKASH